jgi:hypothetical protein
MPLDMSEKKKVAPSAKVLGRVVLSVILWAGTFVIAVKILRHHPANLGIRIGAVLLAVLGFLTWPASLAKLIRMQSEFERRIHLVALGIAFIADALFIFTSNMLQLAGFLDWLSLQTIWLVMFFTWFAAVLGTSWYYRS